MTLEDMNDKVRAIGFWRAVPVDALERILEGKNVNMPYINGYSILHWAAANHQDPLVTKLLLDKHADVNMRDGNNGRTPLHVAILYNINFWAITNELLNHNTTNLNNSRINLNIQDNGGRTPLHLLAIKNEQWDMTAFLESIKLLVRHDRVDCTIQDNNNKTAFDYARENGILAHVDGGILTPDQEHYIITEWRSKSQA